MIDKKSLTLRNTVHWRGWACLASLFTVLTCAAQTADGKTQAENLVKNQPCMAGETIEQLMDRKLKPSHRDLGWRVFAREDQGFDVERSFMVSKSAELRYRWRVAGNGTAYPESERARNLCS